jgi:hypothetical protein
MEASYAAAQEKEDYFHFVKYFAFRLSMETVEREVSGAIRLLLEQR